MVVQSRLLAPIVGARLLLFSVPPAETEAVVQPFLYECLQSAAWFAPHMESWPKVMISVLSICLPRPKRGAIPQPRKNIVFSTALIVAVRGYSPVKPC